jgi:hypothetical protein
MRRHDIIIYSRLLFCWLVDFGLLFSCSEGVFVMFHQITDNAPVMELKRKGYYREVYPQTHNT